MIRLQARDLRLAVAEAAGLGIRHDATRVARALLDEGTAKGLGELGTPGLYRLYGREAGCENPS